MYSKAPFSLHSFYQSHIRFSMLRLLKCRAPKISSCYTIFSLSGGKVKKKSTQRSGCLLLAWRLGVT